MMKRDLERPADGDVSVDGDKQNKPDGRRLSGGRQRPGVIGPAPRITPLYSTIIIGYTAACYMLLHTSGTLLAPRRAVRRTGTLAAALLSARPGHRHH